MATPTQAPLNSPLFRGDTKSIITSPPWVQWFTNLSKLVLTGGVGDVVGPGSSTAKHLAAFKTNSGKILEDSGITEASLIMLNLLGVFPEFYGAKRDGITDDTAAIQAAFNTGKRVFLLPGTYSCAGNLVVTDVPEIIGVAGKTVLQPTAAVTGIALAVNNTIRVATSYNYPTIISGVELDGSLTTNVTGLKIGTSGTSALIRANTVEVYGFKIGLHVADVVHFSTENCNFTRNGSNLIQGSSAVSGLPTRVLLNNTHFQFSLASLGTGVGLQINSGEVLGTNCTFENNEKEGLKVIAPNAAVGIKCTLVNPWFETNQTSEGVPSNFFHIVADGSANIGAVLDFELHSPIVQTSATKAASLKSTYFLISYPKNAGGSTLAAPWKFVSNCIGSFLSDLYQLWYYIDNASSTNRIRTETDRWIPDLPDGNATPDITGMTQVYARNTNPTTYTDFLKGYEGQSLKILIAIANVTFTFNTTNLKCKVASWTPAAGDWLECIQVSGSAWVCTQHQTVP